MTPVTAARAPVPPPAAARVASGDPTVGEPLSVVILGQYFHPEVAGVAQRLTELAVELRQRGVEVRALVAQPSYSGPQRLPRRERYCGVDIERLPLPYFPRDNRAGRAVSGMLFVLLAALRLALARPRGTLLIGTNPPFLHLVGWLLKRVRGQPYVCLVQDIYPDLAVRLGYLPETSLLVRVWERINRLAYRHAERVVTLGARMAETLGGKLSTSARRARVEVIPNWEDPDRVTPQNRDGNWFRALHVAPDALVVLYSGNMGLANDVETLLAAARYLRDRDDILFLFIGGGAKAVLVREAVGRDHLASVRLLPYQPPHVLPRSLTCAEVGAVTLAPGAQGFCVPGKLYTALAAGQAILAIADRASEVADVVEQFRCGLRRDPGDAEGVVDALLTWRRQPEMLDAMQRNARRCFEEHFTKARAVDHYHRLLREVTAGWAPAPAQTSTRDAATGERHRQAGVRSRSRSTV